MGTDAVFHLGTAMPEHWRWADSRTLALTAGASTPNNPDLQRMQASMSTH
jgi:hypothetical protein